MRIKQILSIRTGIKTIKEIINYTQNNDDRKKELYALLYDSDEVVSYQAAWVMCHFSKEDNKWLYDKQNEMIEELFVCNHTGKRRLILTLLQKQSFSNPVRLDFYDFCMERLFSENEPTGVQTLCLKIAFQISRNIPELFNEFFHTLKLLEPDFLKPGLRCALNNVLNSIKR